MIGKFSKYFDRVKSRKLKSDKLKYIEGIRFSTSMNKILPENCAVLEKTADGTPVGACTFFLKDGRICPRHGIVKERI